MSEKHSRVYAKVDTDAIRHNLIETKKLIAGDTKIMAVVKANAYGHGAVKVTHAIDDLDFICGYAVATVEEGIELRDAGITKPILILGYTFPDQYEDIIKNDIRPTVFTLDMARNLSDTAASLKRDCIIHFAVDTGMGRIGYRVDDESADEMALIARLPHIVAEGIFTHFARADEADKTSANEQFKRFSDMIAKLGERGLKLPICHCSNSAASVEMPYANMDMVRAGITIYGLWPSDEVDKDRIGLLPAMSLISHVSYVKTLPPGSPISYGGTYVTDREQRIATIPVGYADGYPRGLSNKGEVLIGGRRAKICGRVCMDQFMVDVTDMPDVKCGDKVVLIGRSGGDMITAEELGAISGRFNYELVCDITGRVPRIY
jgi:alanine racemase